MSVWFSKLSLLVRHLIGPLPKGAQTVKNLPAMQETQVPSLGQEDPLEIGMPTTPVFLPGESHMDRGAWRATVHGITKNQT